MSEPARAMVARRDNRVSMVFNRETSFLPIEPDSYRFKPRGFWEPLQRLCWWLVAATGALGRHSTEETYFTTISFDGDAVLDQIIKARGELFRSRPTRVLIGPHELAEITANANLNDLAFTGRSTSFQGRVGYGPSVFGLEVEIIPHMVGVLVL